MKTLLTNDDRFLRMPEFRSITAISRAHIYLLISKTEFPKQYKLGERAAGWNQKFWRGCNLKSPRLAVIIGPMPHEPPQIYKSKL
jgi:predicted DNA-binding transcriptional regulator AlpA